MFVGNQPSIGTLHSALDSEDEDEVLGKIYDRRVISRLPGYLRRVKAWMLVGGSGVIIYTLATLALPYLAAIIIDNYIQKGNTQGLNIIAILLAGALLIAWLGQFLEEKYLNYAGDKVLFILRTEMFDHLQQLPLSFFDRNKVGRIMSRVQNDVQQLQQLISYGIISIVTSILTLIGITVIMIILDIRLALLTLSVIPVLVMLTIVWQKYARRAFVRVRRAIAVVTSHLQEGISGVRVVQSLSREDLNMQQFEAVNKSHLNANLQAIRMTSITIPAVEILTAISMSLVIFYGGYQVINGNLGVGILLAFILYVQRFFNPVIELAAEYTELQTAMVSGSRILELLDVEPEIKDSPGAAELKDVRGEIRFDHVSFEYIPGNEILHDINLTVHPGETVAIVGRTGAGKSSLVNLISRFYEVNQGAITIDAKDIRSVTQLSLRRQMGIVPQDPFLFSGTIEDNIKYGHPEAGHDDVVKAAKIAAIHDFISRLEKGYATPVGERGINLSNGQRQFICLARALLLNPPILILDEATSNIDTDSERLMQRALQRLSQERTCITIAHRLSTVINAHRIVVLEKGRIFEAGSHRELLEKRGLYYQLFQALTGD